MPKRPIEDALAAFKLSDLQSFKNIILTIQNTGWGIEDALKYVDAQTKLRSHPVSKFCPDCGNPSALYPVNTSACNQVGGKLRSQWYCGKCGYSSFSKQSVAVEARRSLRKDLDKEERRMAEYVIAMSTHEGIRRKCPACGVKRMFLYPVRTPKGKANIYGWKSLWHCEECGHERYTLYSIKDEVMKLRRI